MDAILALIPNWIGDVAMCTPALRALHRRFPDASLTVAGRDTACNLLAGLTWLDRRVIIPHQPGPMDLARSAWRLRPYARDAAVVFPHSFRSALLARLAGARRRVSHARDGRTFLLTDPVEPERENGEIVPVYMAREYIELVEALGCEDDGLGLELVANPETVATVQGRLGSGGPLVGIAPGGAFGPSKRWPAERFAPVADALVERLGARCVLLTGPGEEDLAETIAATAQTPLIRCDDGAPTIETLKATVSLLDLLVCNDSGSRHVAVAFHVPTVCVMGPTSPRYSEGPYEHGEVIRVDVDCAPCQKPECDTDHRCMTEIQPEQVAASAARLLEHPIK